MILSEIGRKIRHDAIQHLTASNKISHKKQNIAEILNDNFLKIAYIITNYQLMITQMITPPTSIMKILCFFCPRLILKIIYMCIVNHIQHKKWKV
jgi:hypothetical protein